jgi:hypothetical protein
MALKTLGFEQNAFPAVDHRDALKTGHARGDTPQEAVLVLASHSPARHRSRRMSATVRDWILGGKIDLNKPHVHAAFHRLSQTATAD